LASHQKANAFHFFVYSNIFIALCACLMAYQASIMILFRIPDFAIIAFIFFSTLCSYSFHWFLTPNLDLPSSRLHWLKSHRSVHTILFVISFLGVGFYGLLLIEHWKWLMMVGFITFLYTAPKIPHPLFRALRKVALGKTVFLAFVWTYVTTMLPLQLNDHPWVYGEDLFACSRFFLIYAICILFDYRDREYDKSIGIRSLITFLNDRGITILFYASLLLFGVFTCMAAIQHHYPSTFTAIMLAPGIITAGLYRYALRNTSDILFYFVLDGLMALSSLMIVIIWVAVEYFNL
jgi:4-hydroxybenzoate polyprenyltransferase